MTDKLRSALNFVGGGGGGGPENDFVGKTVEIGGRRVKVRKLIAQGGFSFVFLAADQNNQIYALKRLIVNEKERFQAVKDEIAVMKKLNGHENIVDFYDSAYGNGNSGTEVLILMEFCPGGMIVDTINRGKSFSKWQVLRIFTQAVRAVQRMHVMNPPMIHRDLKAENLLVTTRGTIKLCDFGSCTTKVLAPQTQREISMAEEEIQLNTTPQYRSPEMVDVYSKKPIGTKSDIWALGCILYKLCYVMTPFEDGSKLSIMNAKLKLPESSNYVAFHSLIKDMLSLEPDARPTADDILERLEGLAREFGPDPRKVEREGADKGLLDCSDADLALASGAVGSSGGVSSSSSSSRGEGPSGAGEASSGGSLLGRLSNMKDNLVTNVREKSTKVIRSVVAGETNKHGEDFEIDMSYITSRVVAMSYPAEGMEAMYRNNIDHVRSYLEQKHPAHYAVFNLTDRAYNHQKLNNKVVDVGIAAHTSPHLVQLFKVCESIDRFLSQDRKNVAIIHCVGGKGLTGIIAAAYFVYTRLFNNVDDGLKLFDSRRLKTGRGLHQPSQMRYLNYFGAVVSTGTQVHRPVLALRRIQLNCVPAVDLTKSGCRPYIEVYQERSLVLSTYQDGDALRSYYVKDGGGIGINLNNVTVSGDVTVVGYHSSSSVLGKGKPTRLFRFQFHTGFEEGNSGPGKFRLSRNDLDEAAQDKLLPDQFMIQLEWEATGGDAGPYNGEWKEIPSEASRHFATTLFSTDEEANDVVSEFALRRRQFTDDGSSSSSQSKPAHIVQVQGGGGGQAQRQQSVPQRQASNNAAADVPTANASAAKAPASTNGAASRPTSVHSALSALDWNNGGAHEAAPSPPPIKSGPGPARQLSANGPQLASRSVPPTRRSSKELLEMDGIRIRSPEEEMARAQSMPASPSPGTPSNELLDVFGGPAPVATSKSANTSNERLVDDLLGGFGGVSVSSPAISSPQPGSATSRNSQFGDLFSFDSAAPMGATQTPTPTPMGAQGMFPQYPQAPGMGMAGGMAPGMGMGAPGLSGVRPQQRLSQQYGPGMGIAPGMGMGGMGAFPAAAPMGAGMGWPGQQAPVQPQRSQQQQQQQPAPTTPLDPFADLTGFGGSSGSPKPTGAAPAPRPASGVYPAAGAPQAGQAGGQRNSGPGVGAQPQMQMPQQQYVPRPNYYVNTAASGQSQQSQQQSQAGQNRAKSPNVAGAAGAGIGAGAGGSGFGADFSDLLGAHNFKATQQKQPGTLKEMMRDEKKAHAGTPEDLEKIKVEEWMEGKRNNLRALISTLHLILWDGSGWHETGMGALVKGAQVKKAYMKACLIVHPDKAVGTANESLAKRIFCELNDAYNAFRESGQVDL
eukprot:Opistho-2@62032